MLQETVRIIVLGARTGIGHVNVVNVSTTRSLTLNAKLQDIVCWGV
jgi:hypothetical protein